MVKISLRKPEAVLLALGLAFLTLFLAFRIYSLVASHAALRKFAELSRAAEKSPPQLQDVDSTLWSEKRIEAYKNSLGVPLEGPVAVLRIQRLSLEVPVFEGVDEMILNRGAGRIAGTARPGESGNIGIAAHRDGFFRVLKDVQPGDRIELATQRGKETYAVGATEIVSPSDVTVLQPKGRPALTLVTCYPFYFIGHAPQRFIVHAFLEERDGSGNRQLKTGITATYQEEVTK